MSDIGPATQGAAEGTTLVIGATPWMSSYPGAHFDGVFLSNFLEHLPTPEHIAASLARMRER